MSYIEKSKTATDSATTKSSKNRVPLKQGVKLRGADKLNRIPVKVIPTDKPLRKSEWIRVRIPGSPEVAHIKNILREKKLASVCEEAACPNLAECFTHGTATFMVMGEICTRRCPFCEVAHGRPNPLDPDEPRHLAEAIAEMGLSYVVITSVDRDDLRDSGAAHIVDCIRETRLANPGITIEVLVPDFRGRMDIALDTLAEAPADVFNHNLESVPRLYRQIRPGADYQWSLNLLRNHKKRLPGVLTKSGLMVGLGESTDEIIRVMEDLRRHEVDMITIGQYLQPSLNHLPVTRFVHPDEFADYAERAQEFGFKSVASGPLVRSSYHADRQAKGEKLPEFRKDST